MSNISIGTKCPVCRMQDTIEVPPDGFAAWQNGTFVQDAFPLLTPDKREQLITGICLPCWTHMFNLEES